MERERGREGGREGGREFRWMGVCSNATPSCFSLKSGPFNGTNHQFQLVLNSAFEPNYTHNC